ncbi:hypothetical protein CEXT_171431 [Caerostris extrusa]|uniref:Uncharacterized protein n=1 Tax=Caerostris extrusa TaxID=172846 RepID=A0AAV4NP24_CAEEX|nr:hypothetical protein CEXT_171431 [Caerostris extrusa]
MINTKVHKCNIQNKKDQTRYADFIQQNYQKLLLEQIQYIALTLLKISFTIQQHPTGTLFGTLNTSPKPNPTTMSEKSGCEISHMASSSAEIYAKPCKRTEQKETDYKSWLLYG